MIRLNHAPVEIDGHKLLVDVPWFMTREESDKFWKGLRDWVRKTYNDKGDKNDNI